MVQVRLVGIGCRVTAHRIDFVLGFSNITSIISTPRLCTVRRQISIFFELSICLL